MTTTRRYFTADEANRMLPLVRRIADDIVHDYAAWQRTLKAAEALAAGTPTAADTAQLRAMHAEAQRLAADLEQCLGELAALGVECKGYSDGLVDFPAMRDGVEVRLCWRLGEPTVAHWHPVDTGVSGRQPLEPRPNLTTR
ncbi:MAG: DUF2203 domain-containing protein [Gemmatimonadaceae bacterium]|jgi:hypothetical protein|nr:DUF2203 domain-containing protein [Gemmatimonadaceae bacterium]